MKYLRTSASTAALILAMTSTAQAHAEEQAPSTVDEIIVTAQKRSESILDVPLSITAVNAETLDRKGVRDTEELAVSVPGMVVQDTSENSPKTYALRGIGPDGATAATVAVYIDDTPITVGNNSSDLKIFDVSRIEILRGPQGTLFGSSAMGGAIRYVTPDPDFTSISGKASAEVGATAHGGLNYEGQIAVGGPINDMFAFRGSAFYLRDGGYIDIVDDATGAVREKNANKSTSYGGRLAVSARLGERVQGTLSAIYQDTEDSSLGFMQTLRTFGDVTTPLARYQKTERADSGLRDKVFLPNLKVTADLGFAELTSSTSYHRARTYYDVDATYALASAFGLPTSTRDKISLPDERDKRFDAFIQELRLASSSDEPLQWLVGAYYRRSKSSTEQVFHSDLITVGGLSPSQFLANGDFETLNSATRINELAGFGELSWSLTPKFKLTAGVRTSSVETRSISVETFAPILGGTTTAIEPPRSTEHPVTPRFSAEYKLAPDHMVYATAAKGYREGGANGTLFLANAACQPALDALGLSGGVPAYESDSLWNYEIGAKGRTANRSLTYQVAAYQVDWSNIQQAINLSRACGGSPIANLGSAQIQGLEGELLIEPAPGLTFGVNFNYFFKAELTEDRITGVTNTTPPTPVVGALAGTRLPNSPDLNVTLSAEYAFDVGNGWGGYVRAEGTHIGKTNRFVQTTSAPNDPALRRKAYEVVSLRAGATQGPLEVSLFVNNLLDADPTIVQEANFAPAGKAGGYAETTIRPRTVGVSVSRSF